MKHLRQYWRRNIGASNYGRTRHIVSCTFVDMFYAVKTGEQDYFKCACQRCGKRIEFPSQGAGMTVQCPHCGKETVLGAATNPVLAKSKKTLWVAMGLIAVVVILGAGAFLWIQKHKSKDVDVAVTSKSAIAPATPSSDANKSPASNQPAVPNKPAVPAETIDDFSVGKITLQKVQGSSLVYAVGTVKNAADHQRFGVRIQLNLLDKENQSVGVVSDYVSVVEPHKDWQFKALLMPTDAKVARKATVADIKEQP